MFDCWRNDAEEPHGNYASRHVNSGHHRLGAGGAEPETVRLPPATAGFIFNLNLGAEKFALLHVAEGRGARWICAFGNHYAFIHAGGDRRSALHSFATRGTRGSGHYSAGPKHQCRAPRLPLFFTCNLLILRHRLWADYLTRANCCIPAHQKSIPCSLPTRGVLRRAAVRCASSATYLRTRKSAEVDQGNGKLGEWPKFGKLKSLRFLNGIKRGKRHVLRSLERAAN